MGMLGTVALDQQACLFKLNSVSVHVFSTFSPPAAQVSLLQGQQTYLPLRMVAYVALDQHTSLKPSSYVCNRFTRLAGMLQYPCLNVALNQQARLCCCTRPPGTSVIIKLDQHACLLKLHLPANMFESVATDLQAHVVVWLNQQVHLLHLLRPAAMSLCSYPTNMLVSTIAPDHHACILQLHLTSSHVFISCILSACMSVTVSSFQDPCILHLHTTISHVCNDFFGYFPCI